MELIVYLIGFAVKIKLKSALIYLNNNDENNEDSEFTPEMLLYISDER
jgi:hypothetical protein